MIILYQYKLSQAYRLQYPEGFLWSQDLSFFMTPQDLTTSNTNPNLENVNFIKSFDTITQVRRWIRENYPEELI